jgi:hypothetical protein
VLALDRAIAPVRNYNYDADGRLRVSGANISKAMVSPYQAREIPGWMALGLDPRRDYWLLRDPNELRKAARSFGGLPVLSEHVNLGASHRGLIVGTLANDARFDGEFLRSSVFVWSSPAIRGIEDGSKRDLSCGYHYRPVMRPGVFGGQRYDGIMTEIRGNHVALVEIGRVGSECSL